MLDGWCEWWRRRADHGPVQAERLGCRVDFRGAPEGGESHRAPARAGRASRVTLPPRQFHEPFLLFVGLQFWSVLFTAHMEFLFTSHNLNLRDTL